MKYTDAWCATFVSAIAIECGLTDIIPVECGCAYMIACYKALGRWRENEHYTPKPGDVIFYDWQDDAVAYRTVTVNGRHIRGFGLPDYSSKVTADFLQKPASGGVPAARPI